MDTEAMLSRLSSRSNGRWSQTKRLQLLNSAQEQLIPRLNPMFLTEITESENKTFSAKEIALSSLSQTIFDDDSVVAVRNNDLLLNEDGGIGLVEVTTPGANYLAGDLVFSGGDGSGVAGTFSVDAGALDDTIITDKGVGYTTVPSVTYDPLKSLNWAKAGIDTDLQSGGNYIDVCEHNGYYVVASWEGSGGNASKLYVYSFDGTTLSFESSVSCLYAKSLYSDGTYLYAGCNGNYLRAFQIVAGTPAIISQLGLIIANGDGCIWGDGNFIYRGFGAGVKSFIFDGTTFTEKGLDTTPASTVVAIWGDGAFLYVQTRDGAGDYLHAYSVDGNGLFTHITSINTGTNTAYDLYGDGSYIYLASFTDGVKAFLFDPPLLTLEGSIDDGGDYRRVFYYGGWLYCGVIGGGLNTYLFNAPTFSNTQQSPATSGDGVYVDSLGVFYCRWGSGLTVYSFAEAGAGVLSAVLNGQRPFYTRVPFSQIKQTENPLLAPTDENPAFYVFAGGLYAIQPTTNANVTVFYVRRPVEIELAVDCELDISLHEIIVTIAESIGWGIDEKSGRAAIATNAASIVIEAMNARAI